jgi:hypothetical protein
MTSLLYITLFASSCYQLCLGVGLLGYLRHCLLGVLAGYGALDLVDYLVVL